MPVTPEMLRLATDFRTALLRRERLASSAMVRHYGSIWERLQGGIQQIQDDVAAIREAGEEPTADQLWRMDRLQQLQRQAADEATRFVEFADSSISGGMREAIAAGDRDSYQLMLAGLPPDAAGLSIAFNRLPADAIEAMVGTLADGSPLRELIAGYVGDAVQGFTDQMVIGLAAGWNPRKLAYTLRREFGIGLTQAMRISRTEMLRAYRTATLYQYRQSDTVTAWERHAANDSRTCIACLVLDGTIYTLEQQMDDHVSGRCCLLPITKTWRELGFDIDEPDFSRELGKDWFQRQPQDVQVSIMGPGRWQAWQDGAFQLQDIPKLRKDDVWGNSWTPKSLKELVGEDA